MMPENTLSPELVDIANRYANVAIWISVASGALMLFCLLFYHLSKKQHAQIVADLKKNSVNTDEIEQGVGTLKFLDDEVQEITSDAAPEAFPLPDNENLSDNEKIAQNTDGSREDNDGNETTEFGDYDDE